jgi:hypothetical protein
MESLHQVPVHHPDLTAAVIQGLAWFYLLAAALNAGAAAYVAYGTMAMEGVPREGLAAKTRRMPGWLLLSYSAFLLIAAVLLLLRGTFGENATLAAYGLIALANLLLAIQAGADAAQFSEVHEHPFCEVHAEPEVPPGSTLDDHIPPVGLGKPINRTRWTIVWAVTSVVFQAMGISYILGSRVVMPGLFKDALDAVAGPTTFFIGATIAFCALVYFRRFLTSGVVAWVISNLTLLYFGLSLTDYDFREIVVKPDNVPIVGMIVLVGFFTWFGLRRAVINDARMARGLPNLEELEPEKTLTWPDLVYTELIAMIVGTIVLIVWAIALQAPLEQPASSTSAPNPSKAPWYFLGLQEMLVYFDPWMAGVVLPTLIIVGLMAMPFIDTNKRGNGYFTYEQRKFAYLTFQYGFLVLWVILILLGTFLRGPNWNFFGPYEYWSHTKLIPLNNVNLSDVFWVELLGTSKPTNPLLRELPGFLAVLAYFIFLPPLIGLFFKDYIKEAGFARFFVLTMLLLFMASLPIKMVLRWTMNLKYVVYLPEIFFNI